MPYSTADYTNSVTGGGFMGPYVPLVDYPAVGLLSQSPPNPCGGASQPLCPALPPPAPLGAGKLAPASCGAFPSNPPLGNVTNISNNQSQWTVQYWPVSGQTNPPNLVCGLDTTRTPAIDFVATEFIIIPQHLRVYASLTVALLNIPPTKPLPSRRTC